MARFLDAFERLESSLGRFATQWDRTTAIWDDQNQHRFHENHVQKYAPAVRALRPPLEALEQISNQARREITW